MAMWSSFSSGLLPTGSGQAVAFTIPTGSLAGHRDGPQPLSLRGAARSHIFDVAGSLSGAKAGGHSWYAGASAAAATAGAFLLLRSAGRSRGRHAKLACQAEKQKQTVNKGTAKLNPSGKAKNVAKSVLARLRQRSPKGSMGDKPTKKMPPKPDPWEIDEDGRKIFPWPKSFAEIVQTSAFSTMALIQDKETRLEVDFPPLPLTDLDWNNCDMSETRIVDSNIQHAIAFCKLLIKDPRPYPKLDPVKAQDEATQGAEPQEPTKITELLERKFPKKKKDDAKGKRTVRILFPNKPDMLRARDIHYAKWRKMDRPELLRRGYLAEVNDENWQGPFEDVFVYIVPQEAGELVKIRNYVEKSDAVATKQGRVLRHVLFNCNLNKLRQDIQFYGKVVPFRPGLATPSVHFDFLATFRNSYLIRFGKYTMTILRDPYNVNYQGAVYHAHPGPWQIFMQDDAGAYRTIEANDKRPSIACLKRRLIRAEGLMQSAGLVWEKDTDDMYVRRPGIVGTIDKPQQQLIREGFGDTQWWEDTFEEEVSEKWRV
eukprot:TRINITY_DN23070_c0_g2_i1.p1 TRINITY_DN23070_c0_g2~~TRINITY_DN23070_c0_g2_i1.p1  ORF type:complete len:541 (+),score=137.31 TRINITY_DN23070_c0_g2_i1:108-1730(+)